LKIKISGVIIGVLLIGGASAFAASNNLVGQKVQGLFSIEKNGAKIADAVIINGSAYAPVRSVAEATGAGLTVEGKKIIMSDDGKTTITPKSSLLLNLNSERDQVIREIAKREAGIQNIETDVIPTHEQLAKELANNGTLGKQQLELVESLKKQIGDMKAELVTLNHKLAEIDAKITALLK